MRLQHRASWNGRSSTGAWVAELDAQGTRNRRLRTDDLVVLHASDLTQTSEERLDRPRTKLDGPTDGRNVRGVTGDRSGITELVVLLQGDPPLNSRGLNVRPPKLDGSLNTAIDIGRTGRIGSNHSEAEAGARRNSSHRVSAVVRRTETREGHRVTDRQVVSRAHRDRSNVRRDLLGGSSATNRDERREVHVDVLAPDRRRLDRNALVDEMAGASAIRVLTGLRVGRNVGRAIDDADLRPSGWSHRELHANARAGRVREDRTVLSSRVVA